MAANDYERGPGASSGHLEQILKTIEHRICTGVPLDPKQLDALVQAIAALRPTAATGDVTLQAAFAALRRPITT